MVDGDHGELTVLVDDNIVAKKGLTSLPRAEDVVDAVRRLEPAGTR